MTFKTPMFGTCYSKFFWADGIIWIARSKTMKLSRRFRSKPPAETPHITAAPAGHRVAPDRPGTTATRFRPRLHVKRSAQAKSGFPMNCGGIQVTD
jgi:hypothetical protein